MSYLVNLSNNKRKKLKSLLLGEISQYIMKKLNSEHICMSASYMVSRILNLYGIKCQPIRVEVMFLNPLAQKYLSDNGTDKFIDYMSKHRDFEDGMWTIGIGFDNPYKPDETPLHAVIIFEDETIMDLTAIQASRLEKNMIIKNYWNKITQLPSYVGFIRYRKEPTFIGAFVEKLEENEVLELLNYISLRVSQCLDEKYIRIKDFKKISDYQLRLVIDS